MPARAQASKHIDVDVNQVTGLFTFIALNRRRWILVSQPIQPQAFHRYGHGQDRSREQPGDVTQVSTLITQPQGMQQGLKIERQRLGAASNALTSQKSWII